MDNRMLGLLSKSVICVQDADKLSVAFFEHDAWLNGLFIY